MLSVRFFFNTILFSLFTVTCQGNAKNVVLSRCYLLVNMTNGLQFVVLSRETQKCRQYELQYIYNELKQYRLYEIKTSITKQIQFFSKTLETRVQRSPVFPISKIYIESKKFVSRVHGQIISSSQHICNNFHAVNKCKTTKSRCLLEFALFHIFLHFRTWSSFLGSQNSI